MRFNSKPAGRQSNVDVGPQSIDRSALPKFAYAFADRATQRDFPADDLAGLSDRAHPRHGRRAHRGHRPRRLVEEVGAGDSFPATHVFGTCRIGNDARCRSHDHPNLDLTDASVFPSSGGGESPSLTIHALAVRAADAIAGATPLPPSPRPGDIPSA